MNLFDKKPRTDGKGQHDAEKADDLIKDWNPELDESDVAELEPLIGDWDDRGPNQPLSTGETPRPQEPTPENLPPKSPLPTVQPIEVFISCDSKSSRWVNAWLIPRLAHHGIIGKTSDNFAGGVAKVTNIERFVQKTHKTLLVITPAWLQGDWSDFEGLLAATKDRRMTGHMIPLILKKCKLPFHLVARTPIDFTDSIEWEKKLAHLVETIRLES